MVVSGMRNDLVDVLKRSKIAGFLVPMLLIIFGYSIIFNQVWPDIEQNIKLSQGYYDTEPVPLVAGDYFERVKYLSNPGSDYFISICWPDSPAGGADFITSSFILFSDINQPMVRKNKVRLFADKQLGFILKKSLRL